MIIAKRLKGKAIATWLGPTGAAARRAFTAVRERVTGAPKRLEFYFDVADPWSYLTAQAVKRLVDAYHVDFAFHAITPPASDVDPMPNLRANHAVRDAHLLAEFYDIDFVAKKSADPGTVRDIAAALIRARPAADSLAAAIELCAQMWANDKKAVVASLGKWGVESHGSVPPALNTNYADLRKAGHYQGAMIAYGGEWYWGIDRLPYLEAALAAELGTEVKHVVAQRPAAERGPLLLVDRPAPPSGAAAAGGQAPVVEKRETPLTCEFWFSFRSPYSYLALEQIEAVLAPYDVPLVLRPIAPMVARGLPMPSMKRMYIVHDAKREADRLGIPFGELCDPLGGAVDNCLAIAKWAETQGDAAPIAFARSAMRGIWTEARDLAEYVDLKAVVERAGLPWDGARTAIADPAPAQKWANQAAADMAVLNLWGVPSFRVGEMIAWGQDRLPLLADRLRRHAEAMALPAPAAAPAQP